MRTEKTNPSGHRVRMGIAGLLMACALSACASDSLYKSEGKLHVKWTEEVQLSDGRVIIAERSDEYLNVGDPGSGWGRGGWPYRRGIFKATLPEPISKTVSWEGTLRPLVLDVFSGQEVYFVGAVAAVRDLAEWKLPYNDVGYVVFRLLGSGWERVTLAELPQTAKPNFLASTRQFFEYEKALTPGSLVDLKRKKEVDSDPQLAKELRVIVRPRTEQQK